jgi:hypothetical protein
VVVCCFTIFGWFEIFWRAIFKIVRIRPWYAQGGVGLEPASRTIIPLYSCTKIKANTMSKPQARAKDAQSAKVGSIEDR